MTFHKHIVQSVHMTGDSDRGHFRAEMTGHEKKK